MADPVMPEYLWLVVVGAFGAFGFGFGTGSNDVGNAFGTSVGAKTLTLKQAVIIAAIFEFAGALLLGRVSISVIAGGIANLNSFQADPEVYAFGMMINMIVGFFWQFGASYLGYNVSATHSIIAGIIGFSFVWGGPSAVNWATPDPSKFPPISGVVPIILAWFISPILSALASSLIFFIVRGLVLRRQNAFNLSFWVLPPFVALTTFVNVYFIFAKGLVKYLEASGVSFSNTESLMWSGIAAAGAVVITIVVAIPLIRRASIKKREAREVAARQEGDDLKDVETQDSAGGKVWKSLTHGVNVDVFDIVKTDPIVAGIHERAEKFDEDAETVFGYLQVFSAICVIFAHGAGEVGYMAGPLATIYNVYLTGTLSKSVQPEFWIIVISAAGLVVGLATYGYNVVRSMGTRLAKLTPSRGFSAELATAMVILVASQYGLPTSSSQVITGAIMGVGLLEGARSGINWKFFAGQFASWIGTLLVVALTTAGFFAQGIFAPSKINLDTIAQYQDTLVNATQTNYKFFNKTLIAFNASAQAGSIPVDAAELQSMYTTINTASKTLSNMTNPKYYGSVQSSAIISYYNASLAVFQNNTVFTFGQNDIFPGAEQCNSNSTSAGELVACPAAPVSIPFFLQ